MKSKFLIVALISVLMVVGLAMMSCGDHWCPDGNKGDPGKCSRHYTDTPNYDCKNECTYEQWKAGGFPSADERKYKCSC